MIVPGRRTDRLPVHRLRHGRVRALEDLVAVEEPMEIRVQAGDGHGRSRTHQVAVTMRTPGDDFELAVGFLFSEGLVAGRTEIHKVTYCTGPELQEYNVVSVALRPGASFDPQALDRNFYTTSSCGVCGKASLDAVELRGCSSFARKSGPRVAPDLLESLPARLRDRQTVFRETGGIHAAALVDADGSFRVVREDVGRHNAVDKVVGCQVMKGRLPATDALLLVSGRASFEILQKALAAGIPMVAAVGAPSTLAVDVARRFGMTLVGFLGAEGFNTYAGMERIRHGEADGNRSPAQDPAARAESERPEPLSPPGEGDGKER